LNNKFESNHAAVRKASKPVDLEASRRESRLYDGTSNTSQQSQEIYPELPSNYAKMPNKFKLAKHLAYRAAGKQKKQKISKIETSRDRISRQRTEEVLETV